MTKMVKARAYKNKEGVENDKNGNRQGTQKEEKAKNIRKCLFNCWPIVNKCCWKITDRRQGNKSDGFVGNSHHYHTCCLKPFVQQSSAATYI